MDPVRVKVYGLFSLTRKTYLAQAATGGVFLVATLIAWWVIWPDLSLRYQKLHPQGILRLIVDTLNRVPMILLVVSGLKIIEIYFVLRTFARKEAALQAKAPKR